MLVQCVILKSKASSISTDQMLQTSSFCSKISQSDTLWEFKAQTRFENIIATGIIVSVLYCNVVRSVLMVL